MINLDNVTKKCGGDTVVSGVTCIIEGNTAILGDRGSGKTAIAELIAGITAPTGGRVTVDELPAVSREAVESVGYMPYACPVAPSLTLAEALGFLAEIRGMGEVDVELALEEAEMDNDSADRTVGTLSALDKKRASLAYALLGAPKHLVLDQPVSGLDEEEEQAMLGLLSELGEKYTIVYLSDTVTDAKAVCSEAVLLSGGKAVASGDFESVLYPDESVVNFKARVRGDKDKLKQVLDECGCVSRYKVSVTSTGTAIIELTANGGEQVEAELRDALTAASIKILELKKADSAAEKVLSALFERENEKEEKRREARRSSAPPVKLTADLIDSALRESEGDGGESEDGDSREEELPKPVKNSDGAENAYRVKLTAEFVAEALRESEDESD